MKKLPFAKKKKLRKLGALKLEAWQTFSRWVRQRGMDAEGFNFCITCGKKDKWNTFHAGHFYHGRNCLSAMDERNVFCQCAGCNTYRGGNLIEYSEFLRKRYGAEIIDTLRELKHQPWKPTREELQGLIETYKTKLELLLHPK